MAGQYKPTDKLSYVIANDYRLLQVMSRFGISLGFGEKTITEVCSQCGVDATTFLAVINYVKDGAENRPQRVERISVASVLEYLRRTHTYFIHYLFPSIRFHLLNAIDCSVQNEIAFLVLKFYDEYVEEVRKHMEYEDSTVYPYVQQLVDGEFASLENAHLLSRHHEAIESKLKELKNLFIQYYPQTEINEKLNAVIISIYQAEEDLSIHCLVEDNIFAPAVRRLEHQNKSRQPKTKELQPVMESTNKEQLSEREREIVVCVAKGLSNKEIADRLCLSINTVTTHRRNIARKLNIHSPAGITIYAIVNKLVTINEVNI
ncbi:MAG: helix-turn-helix transcriptional regulator [Bacteroidaceae bacterium]|nr:helix-turn-helix transcriptional regulator [Bacteroidaceae bacterium]MDE6720903.1 helix-turn-helix transcriptional regulator [Bacteroidaceae bacterium]